MVVLFVVSLLGLIAVPHIEIVKYRMDGSVRGVVTTLLAAQRVAVKQQHDVVVAFDVVNNRIRIHQDANNNGEIDAGERIRFVHLQDGVRFGRGEAQPMSASEMTAVSFQEKQDGLPAVRFLRNGSASEEGWLYLTSTRSSTDRRYAKDTRAVQVNRATGRVSWLYFDPPDWRAGL